MLKRLFLFKWWIAAGLLCAVWVPFMAYQRHRATEEYRDHRATYCTAFMATEEEKIACEEEKENADDYLPWGYKLFEWPEGITAWAIIITGFAITWQAIETRRSAEASRIQATIQQQTLRPRLSVSNFLGNPYEEAALGNRVVIHMKISNSGGMPAYGVGVETWIEFLEPPFIFTSKALHNVGATINVDTGTPQGFWIPFNRRLEDEEISKMRRAVATICFRIRMNYDALGEKAHFDHAYTVEPEGMVSISAYTSAN
jgi:hypothetical protein